MIRRLRTAHRVTFLSLGVVLPIGLAFAVLARPADRVPDSQSAELAEKLRPNRPSPQAFEAFELPRDHTVPFDLELAFAPDASARDWIAITPLEEPLIADLLVYATSAADSGRADLPSDVTLIEALNGTERRVAPWPRDATELIFYSLAKSTRVGSIRLEPSAAEGN
ncbi:MAG: hypothetical protein AAF368_16015 [Planctomycetota bacterium]